MDIPESLLERLAKLSVDCGVELRVDKFWESDFRPGWLCWFRGEVLQSPQLKIEVAGTLCIELDPERPDHVDLFVFVNGERVAPKDPRSKFRFDYLVRIGSRSFIWEDQDPGYEQVKTPDRFSDKS